MKSPSPEGKYNGPVQDFNGGWADGANFGESNHYYDEPGHRVQTWSIRRIQEEKDWVNISVDLRAGHERIDPVQQEQNERDG